MATDIIKPYKINRGFDETFLHTWLKTWSQAFICAFIGAYYFLRVIQK
ncbi:DUF2798 domain-containing protein [Bacillus sp. ISL-7]|nr:DUF2798 domain-containing protein [Bacillus sp. ISL-7]